MNPAVLLLPIAFAASPIGLASTGHPAVAAPVSLGTEAWYSSPQLCIVAQLCLPISSPLAATYPAGTLHIGASAGNESARTYLALRHPLSKDTAISGGLLRLPLDTNPVDGSLAPDLAKIKACTTQVPIKAVNGSTGKPPATDCTDAPVSRIIGTPAVELDIDLAPIAKRLSKPGTSLALLPVLSLGSTWNVTLSSDKRAKSSSTTPVLILSESTSRTEPSSTSSPITASSPAPGGDSGTAPGIVPPPFDIGPETTEPPSGVSPPQIATAVPQAFQRGASAHGFDYPVVFLVPLLILAALLGFGRQLTRPLHRNER